LKERDNEQMINDAIQIIESKLRTAKEWQIDTSFGMVKDIENGWERIVEPTGGVKIVITINDGDHDIIRNLDTGNWGEERKC
jgi:hypothetical protein